MVKEERDEGDGLIVNGNKENEKIENLMMSKESRGN